MLDQYNKELFTEYLDDMIFKTFNNHKYLHISLPTGIGKNKFILKYINDNNNKKFGLFTIKLLYDKLIEDYNKLYNKNGHNINNIQYISYSGSDFNIDTLICLEYLPSLNKIELFKNKNIILITNKEVDEKIKRVLNGLHTEIFNINRIIELSNQFGRTIKINKLLEKINK